MASCTTESSFTQLPASEDPVPLTTSTVPFEAYFDGAQSYHIYNRYQVQAGGSVKTINIVEPLGQVLKKDKIEQADLTIKGLETLILHLKFFSYGKAVTPLDPRLKVQTDARTLPGMGNKAMVTGNATIQGAGLDAVLSVKLPSFEYSGKKLGEGDLLVGVSFKEEEGKVHQKDLSIHLNINEMNEPPICTDSGGAQVKQFIRGDVDGDRRLGASDAVSILSHLFLGVPVMCLEAGSVNGTAGGTSNVDLSDAIYLLSHVFLSGPPLKGPPRLQTDGTLSEFYYGRDPDDIEVYDPAIHKNACCAGTF